MPHKISIYGRLYDIKWGSDKDPDWDPKKSWAMVVDGYTRKGQESFAIIMNPALRDDPRMAHEALLHEVMHVINWREREWRKEHPFTDEDRVRHGRSARVRWRPISHDDMHRIDLPLARVLYDNGAMFECVCGKCRRRKQ